MFPWRALKKGVHVLHSSSGNALCNTSCGHKSQQSCLCLLCCPHMALDWAWGGGGAWSFCGMGVNSSGACPVAQLSAPKAR